jgi:hypothetical protein
VAASSHGPAQQLRNVSLQVVVGLKADGVLHTLLLVQRVVDPPLGEGGIRPNHDLFAQPLLALDIGQQQFFSAIGAVAIVRPQQGRQTASLPVEQQQGVIAGDLEIAAVGAVHLLATEGRVGVIHIQPHPLR